MDDLGVVLLSHRVRLQRIADVLTRYGLAEWVNRVRDVDDLGILGARLAKSADSGLAGLTKGERLRGALVDLGTTWVKFGQMLSLRPDMLGPAVARELEQLQATVPADPPGVAQSRVESELKAPTTDLFASFGSPAVRSFSPRAIGDLSRDERELADLDASDPDLYRAEIGRLIGRHLRERGDPGGVLNTLLSLTGGVAGVRHAAMIKAMTVGQFIGQECR